MKVIGLKIGHMVKDYRDFKMAQCIKANSRMVPKMDLAVLVNVETRFTRANGLMTNLMGRASKP